MLRGGPGRGEMADRSYAASLASGQSVLTHLPPTYQADDILITRDGQWHGGGLPVAPPTAAGRVDIFFNALHGGYGEDGKIQQTLESLGLPYTGSGILASASGMFKPLAKEAFRRASLRTPAGLTLSAEDGLPVELARRVFLRLGPPWVVKPAGGSFSTGVFTARRLPELALAVDQCLALTNTVLVERQLHGPEATVVVVENFRGRDYYPFLPIETKSRACPGCFSSAIKDELGRVAVAAHRALGFRHYSSIDLVVEPNGVYVLEANSLPALGPDSLLAQSLPALGCSMNLFLDHIVNLARLGR